MTFKPSKRLEELAEDMRNRRLRAKEVEEAGGNMYEILEASLLSKVHGGLAQDIVITAIQRIKEPEKAKSFLEGYISNIEKHPEKYPGQAKENPTEYAKSDILLALNLHFVGEQYFKLWNSVLN